MSRFGAIANPMEGGRLTGHKERAYFTIDWLRTSDIGESASRMHEEGIVPDLVRIRDCGSA